MGDIFCDNSVLLTTIVLAAAGLFTFTVLFYFISQQSGSFKTFLLANISPSVSFQIFLTCLGSLINYFTSIVQYIYNYYYLVAGCVLLDSFSVCFKMSCCFLH